jgi:hypothetical protein
MSNPWNFNTRILGPNPKKAALTLEELDNSLLYLSASLENNPTASYLTPLSQSVEIIGSIELTGSLVVDEGYIANFPTNSINLIIPPGYNALLIGPVYDSGSITVSTGSRLVIL